MAFTDRVEFTKEMKKEGYTILAPNMAPIHFRLFETCSLLTATTWRFSRRAAVRLWTRV